MMAPARTSTRNVKGGENHDQESSRASARLHSSLRAAARGEFRRLLRLQRTTGRQQRHAVHHARRQLSIHLVPVAADAQDLAAIAATGSNTVRLVLSTGGQWPRVTGPQVAQLIQWCKDNRLIAVLEVHDSTGWSEQSTAVPISNATAYWTSADIRAAINGQENFVIINIANEPFGNNTTANYLPEHRRNPGAAHRRAHAHAHDRRGQLGPGLVQQCAITPCSSGTRTRSATWCSACTCTRCTRRPHRSPRTCRPSTTWACRWSIGEFGPDQQRPAGRRSGHLGAGAAAR